MLLQEATADRSKLRAAADRLASEGMGITHQSALWDGVLFGASQAIGSNGVPLVLLVTDGQENSSWSSRVTVGRALERLGIAVDVVGVTTPPYYLGTDTYRAGPVETPSDLTRDSGGQYFDAKDGKLGEELRERFDDLRSSYVLTYTPHGVKTDDGWHKVTVRIRGRSLTVKAQPGYFAGK